MRSAAALDLDEIGRDVFGFDVPEGNASAADFEIGCTALRASRFVGGDDAGTKDFHQLLERRTMRVLGRVALSKIAPDGREIFAEGTHPGAV
jgi:hypothetical protein